MDLSNQSKISNVVDKKHNLRRFLCAFLLHGSFIWPSVRIYTVYPSRSTLCRVDDSTCGLHTLSHLERFERSGQRSLLFVERKDDGERWLAIRVLLCRDVSIAGAVVQLRALSSRGLVHLVKRRKTNSTSNVNKNSSITKTNKWAGQGWVSHMT